MVLMARTTSAPHVTCAKHASSTLVYQALMKLSTNIRWLLSALVLATAVGLLASLIYATDAALSILERLQRLPLILALTIGTLMATVIGAAAWLLWRLLRRKAVVKPNRAQDRGAIEARLTKIGTLGSGIAAELTELDKRAANGELYVALFGDVSAGKSSLARALLPGQNIATDVRAGTTRQVNVYRGELAPGEVLHMSDVPGANEWQGESRAVAAREEAVRAHLVLFVVDGDLTRSQREEVDWLEKFGKPLWLVLNKADRYTRAELDTLSAHLKKRHRDLFVVSAGGTERVDKIDADGKVSRGERIRMDVGVLRSALRTAIRRGAGILEGQRQRAVEKIADLKLAEIETRERAAAAQRIVREYAQKAAVGALAAVAPGTDLVIQGVLATRLLQALSDLYGVRMSQLDLDAFVALAGGRLRGTSALVLAIAGNALKAFPGLGTIGGGLVHAVAYAMIFDSLGRAVAQTLARGEGFDQNNALDSLDASLRRESLLERAPALLKLALEAKHDHRGE